MCKAVRAVIAAPTRPSRPQSPRGQAFLHAYYAAVDGKLGGDFFGDPDKDDDFEIGFLSFRAGDFEQFKRQALLAGVSMGACREYPRLSIVGLIHAREKFDRAWTVRRLFRAHGYEVGELRFGGGGHWRVTAAQPASRSGNSPCSEIMARAASTTCAPISAAASSDETRGVDTMLKRMSAEILIDDPHDVNECVAVLIEHDFEVEFLDFIDPYGPTAWVYASVITDIDENDFHGWVQALVDPLGGDANETGPDTPEHRAYLASCGAFTE